MYRKKTVIAAQPYLMRKQTLTWDSWRCGPYIFFGLNFLPTLRGLRSSQSFLISF